MTEDQDRTAGQGKIAPYGTWESPLTAAALAGATIRLADPVIAGGRLFWLETRPEEQGRQAVMTLADDGSVRDVAGPGINARTRVHEYGGGALTALNDGVVVSHFDDHSLWLVAGHSTRPLTADERRYADGAADPADPARLFYVAEDHSGDGVRNAIVSIRADRVVTRESAEALREPATVLFDGSDFVAAPRPSPDGGRLAFIAWDHPDMPWDATTLRVGTLTDDGLQDIRIVAGGAEESVIEPRWGTDGTLYFLSDRRGWWTLHSWSPDDGTVREVCHRAADFGAPLWTLGQSSYALTGDGRAVARYGENGLDRLAVIDLSDGSLRTIDVPFVSLSSLVVWKTGTVTEAVMIAGASCDTVAIVAVDIADGTVRTLRRPAPATLSPDMISRAEAIEFPTAHGRTAHAFFYPPMNSAVTGPEGEKPPLLVKVHGGPTGAADASLNLSIQYWTSRGIALVDVNYGGSTGYGREYRNRLRGNWGITDIEDVTAAVTWLAKTGRIDPDRVAIRGGSAGGYTTLAALAFTGLFKAGANYYGVSDLEALARDTHKFESRYLDRLVAPLAGGEAVYRARSPLYHLDGFRAPLITFQGADDKVVPPSQSRAIVDALRSRGVPVAYLEFEGEQHGFRKAASIIRAQEAELAFYGRIFGFTPAGPPVPLAIDNLPGASGEAPTAGAGADGGPPRGGLRTR
ncbi:MAG: S9 family peptidase [Telmatospirillum sp.]|nr:S9 family peptidase [Telmatospirillum sp.]